MESCEKESAQLSIVMSIKCIWLNAHQWVWAPKWRADVLVVYPSGAYRCVLTAATHHAHHTNMSGQTLQTKCQARWCRADDLGLRTKFRFKGMSYWYSFSYLFFFTCLSGGDTSFLVTVTGSETVKVTEVTLFDSSGPTEVKGSLQVWGHLSDR